MSDCRITHMVYAQSPQAPPRAISPEWANVSCYLKPENTRASSAICEWARTLAIARLRCVRTVCTEIHCAAAMSAASLPFAWPCTARHSDCVLEHGARWSAHIVFGFKVADIW